MEVPSMAEEKVREFLDEASKMLDDWFRDFLGLYVDDPKENEDVKAVLKSMSFEKRYASCLVLLSCLELDVMSGGNKKAMRSVVGSIDLYFRQKEAKGLETVMPSLGKSNLVRLAEELRSPELNVAAPVREYLLDSSISEPEISAVLLSAQRVLSAEPSLKTLEKKMDIFCAGGEMLHKLPTAFGHCIATGDMC
jgi:hypothetical protein